MKKIFVYLFIPICFATLFVSCKEEKLMSNMPIVLNLYFHNTDSTSVFLDELDITLEYTNPKGKTTRLTNDKLIRGALTYRSNDGLRSTSFFAKTTDPYSPSTEGISIMLSGFPVNYPDDIDFRSDIGAVKKFKVIVRRKDGEVILFENSFTYTFKKDKGIPFVEVKDLDIEKDLKNMKKEFFGYHIYLD